MYEIWKNPSDGKWYWHFKAKNNEIICHSQGYKSRQGARKGINAMKRAVFAKVEVKK
jgi:uncharacterized protein YegP (UPF0339 family)